MRTPSSPSSRRACIAAKIAIFAPGTTDTRSGETSIPFSRRSFSAIAARSSGIPLVGR